MNRYQLLVLLLMLRSLYKKNYISFYCFDNGKHKCFSVSSLLCQYGTCLFGYHTGFCCQLAFMFYRVTISIVIFVCCSSLQFLLHIFEQSLNLNLLHLQPRICATTRELCLMMEINWPSPRSSLSAFSNMATLFLPFVWKVFIDNVVDFVLNHHFESLILESSVMK